MKGNNFKSALKVNVQQNAEQNLNIHNDTNETDLLLKKLGLFPVPDNIEATISDDGHYLNIKLKETFDEQHLLFQFPLQELDLSKLESRPDYQELIQRYYLYIHDYVDEIKKYAMLEKKCIQEMFPSLVFNIKIRIKSFHSYISKLAENLSKGKDLYINDIIAERIILTDIQRK